jgi:ABC-type multidrug transport system fused ATPase/permease subunit
MMVLDWFGINCMNVFLKNMYKRILNHEIDKSLQIIDIVFQSMKFFDFMPLGEVVARTSTDSLTIRSLVSTSTYEFFEACVLAIGSFIFVCYQGRAILEEQVGVILVSIALEFAFGSLTIYFGAWVHTTNRAVRRRLGRLYGFSFDSFVNIRMLISLAMENRMILDYRRYCDDYFLKNLKLRILK